MLATGSAVLARSRKLVSRRYQINLRLFPSRVRFLEKKIFFDDIVRARQEVCHAQEQHCSHGLRGCGARLRIQFKNATNQWFVREQDDFAKIRLWHSIHASSQDENFVLTRRERDENIFMCVLVQEMCEDSRQLVETPVNGKTLKRIAL